MTFRTSHRRALRALELFADCRGAELDRIRALITETRVQPGVVLVREGSYGDQFIIIIDGLARVCRADGAASREIAVVGPGDFIGEMALLDHQPRSATVTALTPLTVYACTPAEFDSLLAVAPTVAAKIARTAALRVEANRVAA